MTSSIDFDVKKIIQEIEVLQKVHIPYAANRALKDFGFYAKRFLGEEMRKEFDNPVPFTTRSPYFKKGDLEVSIGISAWAPKGRSPAEYLEPMIREPGVGRKQQRVTRFCRSTTATGDHPWHPFTQPSGRSGNPEPVRQHPAVAVHPSVRWARCALDGWSFPQPQWSVVCNSAGQPVTPQPRRLPSQGRRPLQRVVTGQRP